MLILKREETIDISKSEVIFYSREFLDNLKSCNFYIFMEIFQISLWGLIISGSFDLWVNIEIFLIINSLELNIFVDI